MLRIFSSVLVLTAITLMLCAANAQDTPREAPRGERPVAPREGVDRPRPDGERPAPPREGVDRPRQEGDRPASPREGVDRPRQEGDRPAPPREGVDRPRQEGDRPQPPREGARPEAPQPGAMVDRLMNNFGVIILADLPENVPPQVKEMLEKADADKNGKVTRAELERAVRQASPPDNVSGYCSATAEIPVSFISCKAYSRCASSVLF